MPDLAEFYNGKLRRILLETPKPSEEILRAYGEDELSSFWRGFHYELLALRGVQQAENWHPEGDVFNHTLLAIDAGREVIERENLKDERALAVAVAILCHDFGKATTTEFSDGKWRAHGHAEAGIAPTRRLLTRLEFPENFILRVENLVREHMIFATTDGNNGRPSDKALRRLAKRLHPATIYELVLVMECDQRGRAVPWEGFPDGEWLLARARDLGIADGSTDDIK